MIIDFSRISDTYRMIDLSATLTIDDMRAGTHASIDRLCDLIAPLDDSAIVFVPYDPDANDPFAAPEEQNIGWTLGHLVAHVTASSEEWARYSAILAAGIPYPAEPRLRYETDWRTIDTRHKALQRLEESRRMRLSALDAWPDQPNLTLLRDLSERFIEHFGTFNAPASFLFGLSHEQGHWEQFQEVKRQAVPANS